MKYGITSEVSRHAYETDREQIEKIMRDNVILRAAKQGLRQTGNVTSRWEEAGEFGQPDPDIIFLITSTEVRE